MTDTSAAVMALDVGDRRIGIASAPAGVRMASPLSTIVRDESSISKIVTLADENQVATVVVGLPRGMNGQETGQTAKIRAFIAELEAALSQPVVLQDEAVTSVIAEEKLQQSGKPYSKEDIDMYAAVEILQDYLDAQHVREQA